MIEHLLNRIIRPNQNAHITSTKKITYNSTRTTKLIFTPHSTHHLSTHTNTISTPYLNNTNTLITHSDNSSNVTNSNRNSKKKPLDSDSALQHLISYIHTKLNKINTQKPTTHQNKTTTPLYPPVHIKQTYHKKHQTIFKKKYP